MMPIQMFDMILIELPHFRPHITDFRLHIRKSLIHLRPQANDLLIDLNEPMNP